MSHNKFYGVDDSEFEQIENPLEAIHEIDSLLNSVYSLAHSLDVVGMGCAKDLYYLVGNLRSLVKNAENGILRESQERYEQSQQSTSNMINAAMSMCLSKKPINNAMEK